MLRLSDNLSVPTMRLYQGREEIFDPCRRKWVVLTPEEWVRQRLLQQFTEVLNIPAGWIAVEKEIELNGLIKRYDVLLRDQSGAPWMLVECKAPTIRLGPTVMEQVLRYHIRLQVPFLLISNGDEIRCWTQGQAGLQECEDWPILGK